MSAGEFFVEVPLGGREISWLSVVVVDVVVLVLVFLLSLPFVELLLLRCGAVCGARVFVGELGCGVVEVVVLARLFVSEPAFSFGRRELSMGPCLLQGPTVGPSIRCEAHP